MEWEVRLNTWSTLRGRHLGLRQEEASVTGRHGAKPDLLDAELLRKRVRKKKELLMKKKAPATKARSRGGGFGSGWGGGEGGRYKGV